MAKARLLQEIDMSRSPLDCLMGSGVVRDSGQGDHDEPRAIEGALRVPGTIVQWDQQSPSFEIDICKVRRSQKGGTPKRVPVAVNGYLIRH